MIVDCGSLGHTENDLTETEAARTCKTSSPPRPSVRTSSSATRTATTTDTSPPCWRPRQRITPGRVAPRRNTRLTASRPGFSNSAMEARPYTTTNQPTGTTTRSRFGDTLSCGTARTFVLTVNTGQKTTQSLVVMIEYRVHRGLHRRCGRPDRVTSHHQLRQQSQGHGDDRLPSRREHEWKQQRGLDNGNFARCGRFQCGERFGHPRCEAVNRFTTIAETLEHQVRCGVSNTQYGP